MTNEANRQNQAEAGTRTSARQTEGESTLELLRQSFECELNELNENSTDSTDSTD